VPFAGGVVVNVFIVDDSVIACRMVRQLLAAYPDVAIVGESRSAEDGFALIDALAPDLVVMDWSMPGMNGIEATAEVRRRRPEMRVVGFTSTDSPTVHEAFIEAGATAVFAKDEGMALRDFLLAAAAVG
jgi:DNA-binding NarL/FixJ family response regulator